jgi:hypothetical protein
MMRRVIEEVMVQLMAQGVIDLIDLAWAMLRTPLCS